MSIDLGDVISDVRIVSPRRARDLRQYAKAAAMFFGDLRLDQIHAGHLKEYTRARAVCDVSVCRPGAGTWAQRAGANLIRKELNVVMRVMREAGAWTSKHTRNYRPIKQVESGLRRAMSPIEQLQWLKAAGSREEWRVVYWYSILALATTASTNELRGLRLGDIFLEQGVIHIRPANAKVNARIRTIPLRAPEVAWALQGLIERARTMGATAPYHCLFPYYVGCKTWDPTRCQSAWAMKKPWDKVKAASGVDWLTPYDLRHTAITRYAERGTPIAMIMSLAGHVSRRMQQHYTTVSEQAKGEWAATTVGMEMAYNASTMPAWAIVPPAVPMRPPAASRAPGAALALPQSASLSMRPQAPKKAAPVSNSMPRRERTMIAPAGGRRPMMRRAMASWRTRAAG
jgi:integrase